MSSKLFSFKALTLFGLVMVLLLVNGLAQNNPSPADMKEHKADVTIQITNTADPTKNPVQASKVSINNETKDAEVEIKDENSIYFMPYQKPMYMDGTQALYFFPSKIARYPADMLKEKVQGVVMIRIIVEKDGSISNPEIIASVHPKLDAEAMRVVSQLKNFYPGRNKDGEAVRCYVDVPVPFLLERR
ncbi:MAG: energy transducer TonB [Bacteroidetes bacterium]|nr:energy transducer TonB [Bacteroidota bacterium]MCL1969649.1 energy transducer TonB [Bacteroidota bacterium]